MLLFLLVTLLFENILLIPLSSSQIIDRGYSTGNIDSNLMDSEVLVNGKSTFAKLGGGWANAKQFSIQCTEPRTITVVVTTFDGSTTFILFNERTKFNVNGSNFGFFEFQMTDHTGYSFFINVTSETKASRFSVMYVTEDSYVDLLDGSSQMMITQRSQSVYVQKNTYLKFFLDDDSGFNVILSIMTGDPVFYVSATINQPRYEVCSYFTCWYTNDTSPYRRIRVSPDSKKPPFVPKTEYFIGVHSYGSQSNSSEYIITAIKDESIEEIIGGIQTAGFVRAGSYYYYKFELVQDNKDLTITIQSINKGDDPDVYISKIHRHPDWKNSEWRLMSSSKNESVTIERNEGGGPGVYFISVYGFQYDAEFLINTKTSS